MINEIDITKQYRIKKGNEVRIYAIDNGGPFPVHGVVHGDDGLYFTCWTKNGAITSNYASPYDLVEVKPRIKRSLWVNVYPQEEGSCDFLHHSKNEADEDAGDRRLACVKVEIDCEEGEGL